MRRVDQLHLSRGPSGVGSGYHLSDGTRVRLLVVGLDWYSRRVLSWRLSNRFVSRCCPVSAASSWPTAALQYPSRLPFTGTEFAELLKHHGIAISNGRQGLLARQRICEQLWKSIK